VAEFAARNGCGDAHWPAREQQTDLGGPPGDGKSTGSLSSVCLRGRLSMVRFSGKVIFAQLRDQVGDELKVKIGQKECGAGRFSELCASLGVGDEVVCYGGPWRARDGGLSLAATAVSVSSHRAALQSAAAVHPMLCGFAVLFQDEQVLVLCKPSGVLVHPPPNAIRKRGGGASEVEEDTMLCRLKKQLPYIHTIHRLDRDVSGAITFGLTKEAAVALHGCFAPRSMNTTMADGGDDAPGAVAAADTGAIRATAPAAPALPLRGAARSSTWCWWR
jgi:hypothetical protein